MLEALNWHYSFFFLFFLRWNLCFQRGNHCWWARPRHWKHVSLFPRFSFFFVTLTTGLWIGDFTSTATTRVRGRRWRSAAAASRRGARCPASLPSGKRDRAAQATPRHAALSSPPVEISRNTQCLISMTYANLLHQVEPGFVSIEKILLSSVECRDRKSTDNSVILKSIRLSSKHPKIKLGLKMTKMAVSELRNALFRNF